MFHQLSAVLGDRRGTDDGQREGTNAGSLAEGVSPTWGLKTAFTTGKKPRDWDLDNVLWQGAALVGRDPGRGMAWRDG